jgi:rod shape-determining protein MreC
VEGDFELEKKGLCKLSYLPKDVDLRVGDKIISSGYGGIFPEGLNIGEVVSIEPDELSHTLVGYVKPAADLSLIRDVMIIREFERKFY